MEDVNAISTADVESAVKSHQITTLRVVRSGETVITVGPQDRPVPIHSIRKSIISALFGRLIARGDVQLNATLADFDIDDSPCLTDQERAATLKHLLTSSSGVCRCNPAARTLCPPGLLSYRDRRTDPVSHSVARIGGRDELGTQMALPADIIDAVLSR